MKKIMDWLSTVFAPKMSKVSKNVWIQALQTSLIQTMPLIFVGSLATIGYVIKIYWKSFPDLSVINNYTFGIISLIIAGMFPFNLLEKKGIDKMKTIGLFTGIGLFLLTLNPKFTDAGAVFNFSFFGAQGMFIALITGMFTALIMILFSSFSFFKKTSSIPDFITAWFDHILPIAITIGVGWLIVNVLDISVINVISGIFKPIENFAQTGFGFVLLLTLSGLVYSMGISPWVVLAFIYPIQNSAIAQNAANVAAGKPATLITTFETFHSGWVAIGGTGSTFALVVFMAFMAKSAKFKAVGKASLIPSIMNINEPAVFGAIAWNPLLMLPMILTQIVTGIVTYVALSSGLAAIPSQVMQLWYLPFPIATWLMTRDMGGIILMLVCVALTVLIYYPFFKVADKLEIENEKKLLEEEANKEW